MWKKENSSIEEDKNVMLVNAPFQSLVILLQDGLGVTVVGGFDFYCVGVTENFS